MIDAIFNRLKLRLSQKSWSVKILKSWKDWFYIYSVFLPFYIYKKRNETNLSSMYGVCAVFSCETDLSSMYVVYAIFSCTDSIKINRPDHNIRIYWANFWHTTIHVQQNGFEKTLKYVCSPYLYASFSTSYAQIGQLFEAQWVFEVCLKIDN